MAAASFAHAQEWRIAPPQLGKRTHPQLQKIIEAWGAGQTAREIAKWVKPPLSHVTVWSYCKNVVQPAVARAAEYTRVLKDQDLLAPSGQLNEQGKQALQLSAEALAAAPVLATTMLEIRASRLKESV